MFRMINRTTMAFMGVFLIACLVALVYHLFFVWPEQDCAQRGAWWDGKDRQCLTPLPIWRLTGRTPVPAAQAHQAAPPPVVAASPKAAAKK
jgi:hypothetical protein